MDIKNNFNSIEQMVGRINTQSHGQPEKNTDSKKKQDISFQEILKSTAQTAQEESLRFSKHANQRLADRNIDLSRQQLERLKTGADKAREKGIRESLVMVDNLAFIVNVKNNTVVTAVGDTKDSVFTNIDGAVIS